MAKGSVVGVGAELGDYRLTRALGRGGMGVVYEAVDLRTQKTAAIKILHGNARDAAVAQAFVRFAMEVQAVKRINHPNVVRLLDTGHHTSEDGTLLAYYAMEKVDGLTLAQLVAHLKSVPVAAACVIIRHAALALQAAHAQGIIHRDVKPENIMLASDGRVVILDFGICKFADIHNLTAAGQVMGTSRYLTPEHLVGIAPDARSDVFALGAVLFFLCTGTHLRESAAVQDLLTLMSTGADLKRVQQASVPPEVRRVLNNALAPDAGHRYPTAQALADSLQQAVERLSTLDAPGHVALLLDSLKQAPVGGADDTLVGEPTADHDELPAPQEPSPSPLAVVQAWRQRLRPVLEGAIQTHGTARLWMVGAAALLFLGLVTWGMRRPPSSPGRTTTRAAPVRAPTPAPAGGENPVPPPPQALPADWAVHHHDSPPPSPGPSAAAPSQELAQPTTVTPPPLAPPPPTPEIPAAAPPPPSDAPLYANERNVDNQPLRLNEQSTETDAQRHIRQCAEWANAVGAPAGSCPPGL